VSDLPVCSGQQAVKAFWRLGYDVDHQTENHAILRNPDRRRLTIPALQELAKGTVRALIREAGFSIDQFFEAL
jgi:predicted RNA binding protein YcfA (HicA-like mRNA interferase family)